MSGMMLSVFGRQDPKFIGKAFSEMRGAFKATFLRDGRNSSRMIVQQTECFI
jgi:hypothetical protein